MEIQSNLETEPATLNLVDVLPNGHDATCGENNAERAESQEKRTRFSLSHDEGDHLSFLFCWGENSFLH